MGFIWLRLCVHFIPTFDKHIHMCTHSLDQQYIYIPRGKEGTGPRTAEEGEFDNMEDWRMPEEEHVKSSNYSIPKHPMIRVIITTPTLSRDCLQPFDGYTSQTHSFESCILLKAFVTSIVCRISFL